MNEPIDELITYADHTHSCKVCETGDHDDCDCGYDDAEGKAQAAWHALNSENERLTRERNEAFRMSRCECGPDECCANLVKLHEEIARLNGDVESLLTERRRTDGQTLKLMDDNERLAAVLREAREALFMIARHPIKHYPQPYAVVWGIAKTAIDAADAALKP